MMTVMWDDGVHIVFRFYFLLTNNTSIKTNRENKQRTKQNENKKRQTIKAQEQRQ